MSFTTSMGRPQAIYHKPPVSIKLLYCDVFWPILILHPALESATLGHNCFFCFYTISIKILHIGQIKLDELRSNFHQFYILLMSEFMDDSSSIWNTLLCFSFFTQLRLIFKTDKIKSGRVRLESGQICPGHGCKNEEACVLCQTTGRKTGSGRCRSFKHELSIVKKKTRKSHKPRCRLLRQSK